MLNNSQWQWHANPRTEWMFLSGSEGFMRLYCNYTGEKDPNLWDLPNLYLQKFPAPEFSVTAKLGFRPMQDGDRTGLVVMGRSYSALILEQIEGVMHYSVLRHTDAEYGGKAERTAPVPIDSDSVYLRVSVSDPAICTFSISTDGKNYTAGDEFRAVPGKWIGAKVGLFAIGNIRTNDTGWADFDWFRISR